MCKQTFIVIKHEILNKEKRLWNMILFHTNVEHTKSNGGCTSIYTPLKT
jgi:hypothetical protein